MGEIFSIPQPISCCNDTGKHRILKEMLKEHSQLVSNKSCHLLLCFPHRIFNGTGVLEQKCNIHEMTQADKCIKGYTGCKEAFEFFLGTLTARLHQERQGNTECLSLHLKHLVQTMLGLCVKFICMVKEYDEVKQYDYGDQWYAFGKCLILCMASCSLDFKH